MAITNVGSGTHTCVIATPASLNTETVFGIYQCYWNLELLVKGDVIRLFVTTKVLTGDTEATIFEATYSNDLISQCIICSPPLVSEFSCQMRIEQTAGTGRNIPWAMYRLDS